MRLFTVLAALAWGLGRAEGTCAAQAFYYLPPPDASAVLPADAAVASGPKTLLKLSLLTGEVRLAQSNSAAATTVAGRPTHLFIYCPRGEKGPAVRIRLAAGEPVRELAAGDLLTFELASDQPPHVCLVPASGPETRLAITPTTEVPTHLECCPTAAAPLH